MFLVQSFLSKLDTDDGLVEPTNEPTGVWAFPVTDGQPKRRKEEEYLSHTPPKLIQPYTLSYSAGTDPTVHSLIFGWAGEVGYLSFRAQKNGQLKYGGERSEMTEAGFFSLWVHLKLLCKHYGHISASRERGKKKRKKKKKAMMTELADAPKGKPLV